MLLFTSLYFSYRTKATVLKSLKIKFLIYRIYRKDRNNRQTYIFDAREVLNGALTDKNIQDVLILIPWY